MLGGLAAPGFSFPTGGPGGSWESSPRAGGGATRPTRTGFFYLQTRSVLVFEVQGGASASPHALGSSWWCLVLEQTLLILVRGSEVRIDLCQHHGDVTPPSMPFFSPCPRPSSLNYNCPSFSLSKRSFLKDRDHVPPCSPLHPNWHINI